MNQNKIFTRSKGFVDQTGKEIDQTKKLIVKIKRVDIKNSNIIRLTNSKKELKNNINKDNKKDNLKETKNRVSKVSDIKIKKQIKNKSNKNLNEIFEDAKFLLHPSTIPEKLECRSNEYNQIYNFITNLFVEQIGDCVYISGVPGTGKTATIKNIFEKLNKNKIKDFKLIEINGLHFLDANQFYSYFYFKLFNKKLSVQKAINQLEKYFSKFPSKDPFIVLLVDELDALCIRHENILYHLFDWPKQLNSRLIVLCVANTFDLPERMMKNRIKSRLGLKKIKFEPYSIKDLEEIVNCRIKHLNLFEKDCIQLISRKIASISGDARKMLDICSKAVDIAKKMNKENNFTKINMQHVKIVFDELLSCPKLITIHNSPTYEKIFLQALIQRFEISGIEEALLENVYYEHNDICISKKLDSVNISEFTRIAFRLCKKGLILIEKNKSDFNFIIRLNLSKENVLFELKSDTNF